MKKIAVCALLLFAALPLFADTTIILVRHAEAVQEGDDPELTEVGRVRARALVDALKNAGVAAVFTTQYKRTRATAGPLVATLKIPTTVIEAKSEPSAVVHKILSRYTGKTVLVVGHSNTIPEIVKELSGVEYPKIKHEDNSPIFIVTISDDDKKSVIEARYGTSP